MKQVDAIIDLLKDRYGDMKHVEENLNEFECL